MIKNILKIGMLLVLAISITNCEDGVDGTDGTDGVNGTDGTNGVDGVDGENGEDGLGFDDIAAYGNISVSLDGTRIDDEPFTDTTDFIFTDVSAPAFTFTNSFYVDEEDNITSFNISRFLAAPLANGGGFPRSEGEAGRPGSGPNSVSIILEVEDLGLETERIDYLSVGYNGYNIVNEDLVSFIFGGGFDYSEESDEPIFKGAGEPPLVEDPVISDISFNSETNELSFSFTAILTGDANSTENEVTISTTVDVFVVESIDEF